MIIHTCKMKWSFLLVAICINFRSTLNKNLRRFKIPIICRMMKSSPSIRVHIIYISFVLNYSFQNFFFIMNFSNNCFVNRSLSKDTKLAINLISTIYKMLKVFHICLSSSIIQVLQHSSNEFIFTDFERSF